MKKLLMVLAALLVCRALAKIDGEYLLIYEYNVSSDFQERDLFSYGKTLSSGYGKTVVSQMFIGGEYAVSVAQGKRATVRASFDSATVENGQPTKIELHLVTDAEHQTAVAGGSAAVTLDRNGHVKAYLKANGSGLVDVKAYVDVKITYADAPLRMPDLVVSRFSVSPTSLQEGGAATLSYEISNVGLGASATTVAWFYDGSQHVGSADVPALAPGQKESGTYVVSSLASGAHLFRVKADGAAAVNEDDEDNNLSDSMQVVVEAPPIVQNVSVRFHVNGKDALVDKSQTKMYVVGAIYSSSPFPVVTRVGFLLDGWETFSGERIRESDAVRADVVDLYAVWIPVGKPPEEGPQMVSVSFYSVSDSGGVTEVGTFLYEIGSAYGSFPPVGKPAVGRITVWYDNPQGVGTPYDETTVASGAITALFARMHSKPEVPVATTYTVSYLKGAYGTGVNVEAQKQAGVALTLEGAVFVRIGYTQTGWTDAAGSQFYDLYGMYTADADISLFPVWMKEVETATASPVDFSAEPAADGKSVRLTWSCSTVFGPDSIYIYRSTTRIRPTVPTAEKLGWLPQREHMDHDVVSGQTYYYWISAKDDNRPMSAFVGPVSVTVGRGTYAVTCLPGTTGVGKERTFTFDVDCVHKLPKNAFTSSDGKSFAGWRCSNGKRYDDGMLVFDLAQPGETVTMTAIWE